MYTYIVSRIKANHEIILYFDWLMADRLTLADRVGHKMSDSLTELEMAVNACVTFATKKVRTLEQLSVFTIQRKKDVIKDKKGTKNI